jgi:hypothetical protein
VRRRSASKLNGRRMMRLELRLLRSIARGDLNEAGK